MDADGPELNSAERERFDRLLEDVIASVPARVKELIERVPIVVFDRPPPELIESLIKDGTLEPEADGSDLCGLHTGVAITERSIDGVHGLDWGGGGGGVGDAGPEQICLFRVGIVDLAGGWEQPHAEQEVYEEIRITLLHEIGHHFGLDEDDLDDLGYA